MTSSDSLFAVPRVVVERRDNGEILLRSPSPLPPASRAIGEWLERRAGETPGRIFLAERHAPEERWRIVTYAEARRSARSIAAWMISQGLSADRPATILSENGVDHALFALGAMHAGVPAASLSPAYSLMSSDHGKLKAMVELIRPGAVYVSDEARYTAALAAIAPLHDGPVVASRPAEAALPFSATSTSRDDTAVGDAFARIGPRTIARFLFTSGSTGAPKAVITTHGMLCANQEQMAAVWPFLNAEPPVIVDWLPWSHTFGGCHNLNMVLRNGGSLYIDHGKPAPGLFDLTAANLRDVQPTLCFNVPRGYDMLVTALREDAELRWRFFEKLRLIFYAAAALPQNLWEALDELARKTLDRPLPTVSAWGATETSPLATSCHFQAERSGNIGLPVPGVDLKLVPGGGKLEVRVRGPNVTPGYWRQPAQTRAAFDEEGYYRIGDAVRFADPDRPEAGLYFDGRVSEDFKLTSGVWVSTGAVRVRGIAALDPLAQDIVVAGHDRDFIGFLVFPNAAACREIAGLGPDADLAEALATEAVRVHVRNGLRTLRRDFTGASGHAARARLMLAPPDVDRGEITDKGYINQRAVLENRPEEVARLFGDDPAGFIALD